MRALSNAIPFLILLIEYFTNWEIMIYYKSFLCRETISNKKGGYKNMPKTARIMAVAAVMTCVACAFGSMQDKLARFSTPGPDRYADGSIVVDGECYALVWSPAGTAFAGFNADGTPVSSRDRVVLAGALAQDGKCRDAVFQIPAAEYEALKGGEWAVCLVDTRNLAGVPTGVRNGKPLRVNRWGIVSGGVNITEASSTKPRLAAGGTRSVASDGGRGATALPVRATNLSAVPTNLLPPQITAIELTDGEVWLAVDGTVPYLDYTIISSETPNDFKPDYFSEVVEGDGRSEIAIGTIQSAKRRFFKVKRAE